MPVENKNCPLVTVLMPVYNSTDVFASIDSVLEQNYAPIQFVLIDDGSIGFSVQAVRAYLERHVKRNIKDYILLENQQNLGTVKTLNRGIRIAQGDIIFNLAGDDLFYDEHVLKDWVAAFQETGASMMVGVRENYDHKLLTKTGITPNKRQAHWLRLLGAAELFELLIRDNFVSGCCTAHSRKFFETYGLYDEKYRVIEDFPTTLRFLRLGGQIIFFDRSVIKYRGNGVSSTGSVSTAYKQDMHMIFQNEILPYTKFPKRAERWLRRWERAIEFDRKYVSWERRYGSRKTAQAFLKGWYYLHHPTQMVRKLVP